MRIVLIAGFVGLGLLMGCNLTIYTPPGLVPFKENKLETKSQRAAEVMDCSIKASNAVLPNTQITTKPGYRSPVRCNGYSCKGGYGWDSTTSSKDLNAPLRNDYFNQCMANKGYSYNNSRIPECRPEQIPPGYYSDKTVVHRPDSDSCLIFDASRTYIKALILRAQDQLQPNKK